MALLQQSHEERMAKLREQYVDFTASLLKNTGSSSATTTTSATSAGGGGAGKSPTSSSGGGAGKNPSSGSGGGGAGKGTSSGGVTGGDVSSSNNAAFTKAKWVWLCKYFRGVVIYTVLINAQICPQGPY